MVIDNTEMGRGENGDGEIRGQEYKRGKKSLYFWKEKRGEILK